MSWSIKVVGGERKIALGLLLLTGVMERVGRGTERRGGVEVGVRSEEGRRKNEEGRRRSEEGIRRSEEGRRIKQRDRHTTQVEAFDWTMKIH